MRNLLVSGFLSVPLIGAFVIFALGIIVIYRASRVLNLAHGAMAMVPAYIFKELVEVRVPVLVALPLVVILGAALGVGVEMLFVRRLRPQGPTAQTVGTVAVTGLLIAVTARIWGSSAIRAPQVFPAGEIRVSGAAIRYGDIGLFCVGIVVAIGLFAFFQHTQVGLAMRGAAQNRRAASLMGIDPNLAADAAWALGGGLAALAGVLLAALTNLDPYSLPLQVLPAFVAALIGGLESLAGALLGSVITGMAFGLAPALSGVPGIGSVMRLSGSPQLILAVVAMIVMATRGRRIAGVEAAESGLSSGRLVASVSKKRGITPGVLAGAAALIAFPFVVGDSVLGDALLAFEFAIIAISLVVLIGWVGQISLAQASFVGIGAFITAMVSRGWDLEFPANILVGMVAAAGAAAALGVIALRVRGLYLAVATLIFAWMADTFLFRSPWLGAGSGSSTIPDQQIGTPGTFASFDLTKRRPLYYVALAALVVVITALANLRETRTGRAFFAVRGSEMAAASLGIDVVRFKLMAFALSGALAGLGGGLLMIEQRTVVPTQFLFTFSLQFLAIAVIGGLGSLGGAVASGVLFAALNELFFQVTALAGWLEVVSAGLLAAALLAYPGGLAAIGHTAGRFRARLAKARAARRTMESPAAGAAPASPPTAPETVAERPSARARFASLTRPLNGLLRPVDALVRRMRTEPHTSTDDWLAEEEPPAAEHAVPSSNGHDEATGSIRTSRFRLDQTGDLSERPAVLEAERITVRFGGLLAVNDASLAVRRGTVTGLIGPNGAGKTTLFNAILGLNEPSAGRISLFDRDVTGLPSHVRARLGVARTFQVLQLFSELTVFDNLLVATHLHNRSGLASNLVASRSTLAAETAARRRVRRVLRMLELEGVAHLGVRGLPFGTLRMVELGRALATGARLIMLDEPASGLNEAETDRLSDVIAGLRDLGISVLLIEHDVRMVTGVCDYVYVLDQGRQIAQGTPAEIQRDPRVVAAYLGEPAEPARETSGV